MPNDSKQDDNEDLARDLLFGAAQIAKFIGRPRQFVYAQQTALGVRHVGATLVASKTALRKTLTA
jgi:hypothetical protein